MSEIAYCVFLMKVIRPTPRVINCEGSVKEYTCARSEFPALRFLVFLRRKVLSLFMRMYVASLMAKRPSRTRLIVLSGPMPV